MSWGNVLSAVPGESDEHRRHRMQDRLVSAPSVQRRTSRLKEKLDCPQRPVRVHPEGVQQRHRDLLETFIGKRFDDLLAYG
jgi:hypothetical protein